MDPVLRKWLDERGLSESSLERVGCTYDSGVISYPRYQYGFDVRGNDKPIGYKKRSLATGRFWTEPASISHKDTHPLIVSTANAKGAMICEGESDTMRLAETSLPKDYGCDVICIPGANSFPAEWVPLLRRYDQVVVFMDADEAGRALPNRLAGLVPGVRAVVLPDGDDVCSFLLTNTEDDLRKLYEIAPLYIAPPAPLRRQAFVWDSAAADGHRGKLVRVVCEEVQLRKRGNEMVGLCPFHSEKTPSFSVNPERGLYRCFGCGEAGDVVSYLKNKRGMSFAEAMRYLEEY